jgi:hypothetical protein
MEAGMLIGMTTAITSLGTTSAAISCGGGAVLVGLVGFALLLLLSARPPVPEAPGLWGPRQRRLIIGSTLLMTIGGAVLLGGGIKSWRQIRSRLTAEASRQNQMNNILTNISKMQAEQIAVLRQMHFGEVTALRQLITIGNWQLKCAILGDPKYKDLKKLNWYEFKVSSQNGEDGIIAEIFRRIGTTNRYFVDFGSSDGAENNTALLVRQGWSGLWIDGDEASIAKAKTVFRPEVDAGRLTALNAFITAENIEDLFRQGGVPDEFDLLSIDIDRNDYHVWEKITHYRPRVVIVEYNGGIPPTMSWKIPYDPKAFGFNSFGNGNGASVKALEELGAAKGYRLVGCNLTGVNAFFVRDDLIGDHFAAPYTAENHYEPFRYPYVTGQW